MPIFDGVYFPEFLFQYFIREDVLSCLGLLLFNGKQCIFLCSAEQNYLYSAAAVAGGVAATLYRKIKIKFFRYPFYDIITCPQYVLNLTRGWITVCKRKIF